MLIIPAVRKSSATIIFLLFILSAITPPRKEKTTIGMKELAVTAPKSEDEFVSLNK